MDSVPRIADNRKLEKLFKFSVRREVESARSTCYPLTREMCEVRRQKLPSLWRPDSLFDVPDPAVILPAPPVYRIMVTERRFYAGSRGLWDMNENALEFS